MSVREVKGLDRLFAKEVVKLWNNPDDRKQMMETGMTDEQIRELKQRFGLN
jgi:hypothetical protein